MTDFLDREEKFTNDEFAALPRNAGGDIIPLAEGAFIWLTDDQKERLTGDDQTRLDDLEEEVRVMAAEFMAEEFI